MSHNTVLHRLIRPLVARLTKTKLRPNHLTALRIGTAIAAAAAFSAGSVQAIRVGSGLFVISALLDRADGELARQTGRFSRWGHFLDLAGDCSADAMAMLAIGASATRTWLGGWAPVLGLSGAISTAVIFWCLNRPSHRPKEAQSERLLDPDDAVLGIPVLACVAGLPPVLLLAGGLTPLVAVWLLTRNFSSGASLVEVEQTKAGRTGNKNYEAGSPASEDCGHPASCARLNKPNASRQFEAAEPRI